MASSSRSFVILAIQAGLAIVIVVLAVILYRSITGPWQAIERERDITQITRDHMSRVREALIRYERQQDRFPPTLDSLVVWLNNDSAMVADRDSLFGSRFNPDSLYYSPRCPSNATLLVGPQCPGPADRFNYSMAADSLGRFMIYLLEDPNPKFKDRIGSTDPTATGELNAASWE